MGGGDLAHYIHHGVGGQVLLGVNGSSTARHEHAYFLGGCGELARDGGLHLVARNDVAPHVDGTDMVARLESECDGLDHDLCCLVLH